MPRLSPTHVRCRNCAALALLLIGLAALGGCDDRKSIDTKALGTVQIAPDDPELVAAAEEARKRWPEFVDEFQNRRDPNAAYAVKVGIPLVPPATGLEHMWLQVRSINGDAIVGSLDNDPIGDVGLKRGDTVHTTADKIDDWMIGRGKNDIKGLFSLAAMKRAHERAQKSK